jgi:predicted NBD/HSP70 family sugar kinase
VNLAGDVQSSTQLEYPSVPSGPETVALLSLAVNGLLETDEAIRPRLAGCGIGMAGPVDHRTGIATAPNNFAGWRDIPLASMLSEKIGIPVAIDKETNMAMLSEHWQAPRKGWNVVIYVGTGIGAAWTIDGEVYRGSHSDAGEFGHTVIDLDGPLCVCGRHGCVEVFTSPAAVVQKYDLATGKSDSSSKPVAWNSQTTAQLAEIAGLARRGDAQARASLYESGYYLGISAANLVTLLDIDNVTLAGPMLEAVGPHYLLGVEDGFLITETDPQRSAQISVSPDLHSERIASGAAFLFLNRVGT